MKERKTTKYIKTMLGVWSCNKESIKVDRSQSKLIFELKYRRVNEGYLY